MGVPEEWQCGGSRLYFAAESVENREFKKFYLFLIHRLRQMAASDQQMGARLAAESALLTNLSAEYVYNRIGSNLWQKSKEKIERFVKTFGVECEELVCRLGDQNAHAEAAVRVR